MITTSTATPSATLINLETGERYIAASQNDWDLGIIARTPTGEPVYTLGPDGGVLTPLAMAAALKPAE